MKNRLTTYQAIYDWVAQIPQGRVSTYGQIARLVPRCSARMVGYALATLSLDTDIPWHRVVNSQGKISLRSYGEGSSIQRQLLESEAVRFDSSGKIDLFEHHLWSCQSDVAAMV